MPVARTQLSPYLKLAGLLGLTVAVYYALGTGHPAPRRATCQLNLRQLGLALKQYIQDYNEYYPPAGPNRTHNALGNLAGWADSITPYISTPNVYQCPSETHPLNPSDPSQVDYGYSLMVAGNSEAIFNNSSDTILNFEANQMDGFALTASIWNTNRVYTSRHLDGSNYSFVDGHVKWLQSTRCPGTVPANGTNFTFDS